MLNFPYFCTGFEISGEIVCIQCSLLLLLTIDCSVHEQSGFDLSGSRLLCCDAEMEISSSLAAEAGIEIQRTVAVIAGSVISVLAEVSISLAMELQSQKWLLYSAVLRISIMKEGIKFQICSSDWVAYVLPGH